MIISEVRTSYIQCCPDIQFDLYWFWFSLRNEDTDWYHNYTSRVESKVKIFFEIWILTGKSYLLASCRTPNPNKSQQKQVLFHQSPQMTFIYTRNIIYKMHEPYTHKCNTIILKHYCLHLPLKDFAVQKLYADHSQLEFLNFGTFSSGIRNVLQQMSLSTNNVSTSLYALQYTVFLILVD